MRDPILITGCARSGTSLIAGVINNAGAFGGDMFGSNKNNQKGMFENKSIRQEIVKPYLRSIGADPLGQKPLPDMAKVFNTGKDQANKWRNRIIAVMQSDGYHGGEWFYKGAKSCLYWYLWHQAFPQAKWIIVRRQDKDIASSCMRTSFMRAYQNVDGWLEWVAAHKKCFMQMNLSGLDVQEVWPEKLMHGDLSELKNVINNIGLEYDEDKVKEFIEPKLWNKGKNNGE